MTDGFLNRGLPVINNYHPNKEWEGLEQTFQLVSLPVGNSSLQSLLYRHTDFPGYTLYCEV